MKETTSSRESAISSAYRAFDTGALLADLNRRVAFRTESQNAPCPALHDYLNDEIGGSLRRLGFTTRIVDNPVAGGPPFLIAERHESDDLPTVLTYGHGDVVRGYDDQWRDGLKAWEVVVEGDRWYGRGTADNKGQHSINFAALEAVLSARGGRLGYNVKVIFEMGEEIDSPGLNEVCAAEKEALSADLWLASDGPRVSAQRPTLCLGCRGGIIFELIVNLREGGHHSGNWGGALRSPSVVLSHAIASLVDSNGRITIEALRPPPIPDGVREALADIQLGEDASSPEIDAGWGEPGLTPTERVIAWNAIEVLAFKSGNPDAPVSAIPPSARAVCELRYVVGTDWERLQEHLERHFAERGLADVQVKVERGLRATRLDLDDPWVRWALDSMRATTGKNPVLLPNLGGSFPFDAFANTLGLPSLLVPHSYPACSQHAPNEHLLASVAREALGVMAGLWWDLGESGRSIASSSRR